MGIPQQIAEQSSFVEGFYKNDEGSTSQDEQVIVNGEPDNSADDAVPEPSAEVHNQNDPAVGAEPSKGEDWEYRFKQYKSSTDRTIHELRQATAERQEALAYRDFELEGLRKQLAELEKRTPRQIVPDGVLSEDDIESLGRENIERIAKLTDAKVNEITRQTQAELADLRRREMQRDQNAKAQEAFSRSVTFWDGVRKVAGDVDSVDRDPKFSDFLNKVEQYSGKTWRQLGESAKAASDVERMANIYRRFQEEQQPYSRSGEVVPKGAGSAAVVGPRAPKTWTRKDYQAQVVNLMRGVRTVEKDAKINALHADFVSALREGRVIG